MKKLITLLFCFTFVLAVTAQDCDNLIKYVKSKGYGSTYSSLTSDAISQVTFYTISIDYQTYNFAIVCFKNKNSYACSEYILCNSLKKKSYF
jgi:hypothetical protein